jgi:hypothetical protein
MILSLSLVLAAQKTSVAPAMLARLADKVAQIGETSKIDGQVASFLKLKPDSIKWTSAFDSERQVQVYGAGRSRVLIFLVPEKPFPEFGKTWVYGVKVDGKTLGAGVCEPRAAYKPLRDAKEVDRLLVVEADYWIKTLDIGKN